MSEHRVCFACVSSTLERMEAGNETLWLSRYLRKYEMCCFLTYVFGKMCFCGQIQTPVCVCVLVNAILKYTQNCCYGKPAE